MIDWIRDKYWDFKEWWYFRKRPIRKHPRYQEIEATFQPCNIVYIEGIRLVNTHNREVCEGRPCVIHNPTDHALRSWRLIWRDDRAIFERVCPEHGCGHPDPDQFAYWKESDQEWQAVHGCCGCCTIAASAASSEDES